MVTVVMVTIVVLKIGIPFDHFFALYGAYYYYDSLSQQGVWVSFRHPDPQKPPFRTPNFL